MSSTTARNKITTGRAFISLAASPLGIRILDASRLTKCSVPAFLAACTYLSLIFQHIYARKTPSVAARPRHFQGGQCASICFECIATRRTTPYMTCPISAMVMVTVTSYLCNYPRTASHSGPSIPSLPFRRAHTPHFGSKPTHSCDGRACSWAHAFPLQNSSCNLFQ